MSGWVIPGLSACRPSFQLASIFLISAAWSPWFLAAPLSGAVGCVMWRYAGEKDWPLGVPAHFSQALSASVPSETTASIGSWAKTASSHLWR